MKKRILSFFLIFCMAAGFTTALPITAGAAESGSCGKNLSWVLDNGTLAISGTGDITDDDCDEFPWLEYRSQIQSVIINEGVTGIGDLVFEECRYLTDITIPSSVTYMDEGAFSDCLSLTFVTVSEDNPFYSSDSYGVLYNKSKTELLQYPVGNKRTSFTIPDSVADIGRWAFLNCWNLTSIAVSENNPFYSSDGYGVLYNKSRTELLQYPVGSKGTSFTIPDSVTYIGNAAFYGCILTNITIPNSVTEIGAEAFEFCENLNDITIPGSVTVIGDNGFFGCSNLTAVIMLNGVAHIGLNAFRGCENLTAVAIPNSIGYVGNHAFDRCNSLTDVYYSGTREEWDEWCFRNLSLENKNLRNAHIHDEYVVNSGYKLPSSVSDGTFQFSSGKKKCESFTYDDNYLLNPSNLYNHDLARFSMRLALSAFAKKTGSGSNKDYSKQYINVQNLLQDCGFEEIEHNRDYEEKPRVNGIGVIAGHKKVSFRDGGYTLIAMVIRGGNYETEWGGNFNIGSSEFHEGFKNARNSAIQFIQSYIDKKEIQGNIKLLITGYSRAAATANLTAAYFDEYPARLHADVRLSPNNLYAYCFETPAGVVNPDNSDCGSYNGLYSNIFSIVNQHDVVPMLAMRKWGFDRYGKTLYLPAAQTNSNYFKLRKEMIKLYDEYIGNNEEDVAESDKSPYKIDTFSKYTYIGMQLWPYDLYYAQGVYLERIANKLAGAIGGTKNYENSYQDAFMYVGEELIGNEKSTEFVDYLLLDVLSRLAVKQIVAPTMMLAANKYIIKKSIVATFEHFGITVDDKAVNVLLNVIISLGFDDFLTILKNFDNFKQAHYPELCMAWLDTIDASDLTDRRLRTLYLNCPVDLEVYDSNDRPVAAIYDNEPQKIDGSAIIAYIDENNQKVVCLPQDEEYSIKILATDDGEVTYSIQEYNAETDETTVINYNNMTVKKGDVITGAVGNLTETEQDTYSLVSNSVEVNEPEIIENAEIIEIGTTVNGNGVVNDGGKYYNGEYAQVTATAFENEDFLGWYNGNTLVSNSAAYRFQVSESLTLTAKFTENTCAVTLSEIDDDIIDVVRVLKGNAVMLANEPQKEGYTFNGLYTDNTLKTELADGTVFYEDTILYVKWTKNIEITSAAYTDNSVVVSWTMSDKLVQKSGVVSIALYDDKRLVGLKLLSPEKSMNCTFENLKVNKKDDSVKIMYWNSMTDFIPFNPCETAVIQ